MGIVSAQINEQLRVRQQALELIFGIGNHAKTRINVGLQPSDITFYRTDVMKKVLLVDDNSDICRMMRIALRKSFEVLEAEDGKTALEVARRTNPDLIVLDVMMPGALDGLQVLDAIRSDPQLMQTRVIMVTACGQAHDYETGMARGADAYFVKPFSPLQLVAAIKELSARVRAA